MIKIRLMRIGTKKRPFYRVVVVDERKQRSGAYIESLGTYNPLTTPKEINLNQQKIDEWVKKGAQMSDGFLRIVGQAAQKPARKPKKAPAKSDLAPEQPTPIKSGPKTEPSEPKEPAQAVEAEVVAPTESQN